MTADTRRVSLWKRSTVRLEVTTRDADRTEAPYQVDLWEAPNRAYLVVGTLDGQRFVELSAGIGYLREHDHATHCQVLRTGLDTEKSLGVVRRAFPLTGQWEHGSAWVMDPDAPTVSRIELDDVTHVRADVLRLQAATAVGPTISRARGYEWEFYGHRQLNYISNVLDAQIPAHAGEARLAACFLYGASWATSLRVHVIWHFASGEAELIVGDDLEAIATPGDSGEISLTGAVRTVDVKGSAPELVEALARALPIDRILESRRPMPIAEGPGRVAR